MGERTDTRWLRVTEVARLLGVSANTVRRWTDAGTLAAHRSPGGHRRYREADVLALLPAEGPGAAPADDPADLRRESDHLRAVAAAGLELGRMVTEAPRELPQSLAHHLCRLTATARCEVFSLSGDKLRLIVSMENGQIETGRTGQMWSASDWSPVELNGSTPRAIAVAHGDPDMTPRARQALRRRGCRSLAWAPLSAGGRTIGAVELSDAGRVDLVPHLSMIEGFAGLCAQGLQLQETYDTLERRERAMQELIDLSHEIAATHDIRGFVQDLAHRLMEAVHADDVDIWRVKDGRVTCLVSLDRDGVDAAAAGSVMDLAQYPHTADALERLMPFVVDDIAKADLTPVELESYTRWGFVSSLTMPLVAGGRLVGLVDVYDDAQRDWSLHIPFLTGLLQPVAGLFDNAVLLREVEQFGRFQEELVELSAALSGAGALRDLAEEAARRLRQMTGCEDCDIWWLEEGYLRCLASVDGNGVDETVQGKVLELGRFPSTAEALRRREPLMFETLDDPRVTDFEREDLSSYGYSSAFSLPLINGDETLGLIDLFDTRERDYAEVREVLLSAGGAVAGALKSRVLMDRLRHTNTALRGLVELSDEMNEATALPDLARTVATRLRDILQAEDCDIWRIDDGRMLCLASLDSNGWDEGEIGSERDLKTYSVAALTANEPIVIGDLEAADLPAEELRAYRRWGYRSMVSLPVVAQGRLVGLIDVFDTRVRDYVRLLDFIRSVGRLLAGAFEKALLVDRLAASNRELRTLVGSALEFGSSLDITAVLDTISKRILEVSEADMCDVCALDDGQVRVLVSQGGSWDVDPAGLSFAMDDYPSFSEAIRTRQPVVNPDVLADPAMNEHERREAQRWGYRASLDVPLFAHGEAMGFVSLYNREPRAFARLDLIVGLSQTAGQAIANAALYESEAAANRETRLLNEIAQRTAASLDLEAIVEAAVDELRHLLQFDSFSLLLVRDDTVARVIGSRQSAQSLEGLDLDSLGRGLLQRVVEERVLLLRLPGDLALPAAHPAIAGLRSVAVISLPSDTGIAGALNLASSREDAFAGADVHLLERVGTQLSLAIKNAQLYDEVKQMHLGNLKALSSALNAKDYYTLGHAARVAAYTVMLGRELGWDADLLTSLEEAAYLHDIGKISISDRVLLKPGRLNQQEWQQMRQHPVFSADIIRPLFPESLMKAVRHHHERYDGGGYPDGLAGEEIPTLARAMAVVDAYDAMSCRRPYKAAMSYRECLRELKRCSGSQFDPEMVDAFLAVLTDVAARRKQAVRIAREAAGLISGDEHRRLQGRDDEESETYAAIAATLRQVRDANPPTRFLTTHLQVGKKYVIGVDPEEDVSMHSHFGDEIFADDELPAVLGGGRPQGNTVYADEFGVWVTGLAPILDSDDTTVAAVAADLPALRALPGESSRAEGRQTFASMLQSAAVRLNRAEIDSITDALTGLYNHRYLHERLSEELLRARETDRPLSVLFCDLDQFKLYNDANGHSAGDHVLREIAHIIEQGVRGEDVASRYGGEEFVVLLVETGKDDALAVAERIRERVRDAGFSAGGTLLTTSIGVASFPDDAERREDLLELADAAMYVAKRIGRDRVVPFSPALAAAAR